MSELPQCRCGFLMPGPLHARDCKLCDLAKTYAPPPKRNSWIELRSDSTTYARFEYEGALPSVGTVIRALRFDRPLEVLRHEWLFLPDSLVCTIHVRELDVPASIPGEC